MKHLLLTLFVLCVAGLASAQNNITPSASGVSKTTTIGNLQPAALRQNICFVVIDGATATDCTTGGGSTINICCSDGATYIITGDGAGGGSMTSFTAAGDSGGGQTIEDLNTLSILGGTNGIDTVDSVTDTVTINFDATEVGTVTWGSGSNFTWTFNATGAGNPTIAFGDGTTTFTGTVTTDDLVVDGMFDLGTVETFGNPDTTPDVSTGSYWNSNATGQTLTDFDGTILDGQIITIISKSATVYDCTASGLSCGSTDITTASGDVTVWQFDGTDWHLIAFKDASANMGAPGGVAGADTEVQFNASGVHGAEAAFNYNSGTNTLTADIFDVPISAVGAGFLDLKEISTDPNENRTRLIGAASLAADLTWTLPSVDPTANQCLGDSDANAILEWVACTGSGDITDVFDCSSGNCNSITISATDLLDMSGSDASTATEGFILPQHATACAGGTAEGQMCWEADANILHIGDSAALQNFLPASAFSSDAVVSATGAVTLQANSVDSAEITAGAVDEDHLNATLTFDDGDLLDFGTNISSATEGILIPAHATTCVSATAEGQLCWEEDADELWIGDGAAAKNIGAGTGDITDVFNCSTGDCASITIAATDLLNMSGSDASTATEGLILPQHATACAGGTAEGQVCWEADANILHIGDSAALQNFLPASAFSSDAVVSATGAVTLQANSVDSAEITAGAVDEDHLNATLTFDDGDLLDFGTFVSSATEGLMVPANATACTTATAEGQVCWEEDAEILWIGNGTAPVNINGTGSGDITDVFDCASGNCDSITISATDLLNLSGSDASTGTEGLILPQHATACAGGISEGQVCWEADANILHIGDAAALQNFLPASAFSSDATVSATGAVTLAANSVDSAEITAGAVDEDHLNATLTFDDGDLLDFGTNISTATEGIMLPAHATTCASATAEGQVCWEEDANELWIGDGAAAKNIGAGTGDITDVFNCSTGDCASITIAATDLLDMSGSDASTGTEGLVLPQHATACAGGVSEGQVCWEADANILHIGDAAALQNFLPASAFSSDATVSATGTLTLAANSVDSAEITAGAVDEDHLNATLTFDDGDLLDFGTNISSATEGILIPAHATTCASATAEGQLCWEEDADNLWIGDGAAAKQMNGAASGDAVTVNGSAADTTANFLDGDIDWTLADGGAGGPDDITGTVACTGCVNSTDIFDDTIDFIDMSATMTVDAATSITINETAELTFATGSLLVDSNPFTFQVTQGDDADAVDDTDAIKLELTSDSVDAGDTFDGIVIDWLQNGSNAVMDSAIKIINSETVSSGMTVGIILSGTTANSIVTGIDLSSTGIGDAINIGSNPIQTTAQQIESTELDRLFDVADSLVDLADTPTWTGAHTMAATLTLNDNDAASGDVNLVLGDADETGDIGNVANIYDDTGTSPWLGVSSCGADTGVSSANALGTIICTANSAHTTDTNSVKEICFDAASLQPLETNFAPLEKVTSTNSIFVRAFGDAGGASEEYVNGKFKVPSDVSTTGADTVTFRAHVVAKTPHATNTAFQWDFEHLAIDNDEPFSGAYTVENSGDLDTIPTTANDVADVSYTETLTNLGWAADDLVIFRLGREDAAATELVGDLYLLEFCIEIPRE